MGFVFIAGLAGLAALGWPLYLHLLRKREPRVEVVPSLKLFSLELKKQRRLRLTQLLLLLLRLLAVAALVLLVAQAVVKTRAFLPLPRLDALEPPQLLGAVLDDSVTAAAASAAGMRFARQREWLQREIARLPEEAGVCLGLTSSGQTTPLLLPKDALRLLADMEPVPVQGRGTEALAALRQRLSGYRARICIAAPRGNALWPAAAAGAPLPETAAFMDSSEFAPAAWIERVEPEPTGNRPGVWTVVLHGEPSVLSGRTLVLRRLPDAVVETVAIPPPAAFRGRLEVQVPADAKPEDCFAAELQDTVAHPWLDWYFQPGRMPENGPKSVLFIYEDAPASILARKIAGAAVQSVLPDARLYHLRLDPAAQWPADPPPAIAVLAVQRPPAALGPWLQAQLARGRQVLLVPAAGGGAAPDDDTLFPQWGALRRGPPEELLPLKINTRAHLPETLAELMGSGLAEFDPGEFRPAVLAGDGVRVLETVDGQPLLTARVTPGGGTLWALGAPLELEVKSAAYQPLLPHLLVSLLTHQGPVQARRLQPALGEPVLASQVWGRVQAEGTLTAPDGGKQKIVYDEAHPLWQVFDRAGVHRLETSGDTLSLPVNEPRPIAAQTGSRAEWQARFPNVAVTWLGTGDPLPSGTPGVLAGDKTDASLKTFDLSPWLALVLLAAVALEALLYLTQRRPPEPPPAADGSAAAAAGKEAQTP